MLFYVFGGLAVLASLLVIAQRNPVYSVLLLIASFGALSGLYILLDAPFVAVIQIIVYAGAIMVLFLFVIMLLNLGDEAPSPRMTFSRILGGGSAAGLLAVLAIALNRVPKDVASMGADAQSFGTLRTIGQAIFSTWLLPFEAVSLLLLVAMVGAVVVAKSRI